VRLLRTGCSNWQAALSCRILKTHVILHSASLFACGSSRSLPFPSFGPFSFRLGVEYLAKIIVSTRSTRSNTSSLVYSLSFLLRRHYTVMPTRPGFVPFQHCTRFSPILLCVKCLFVSFLFSFFYFSCLYLSLSDSESLSPVPM